MTNSKQSSQAKKALNLANPVHLLATGFGSGLSPIVPGTMGTLAALPIWWFLLRDLPPLFYLAVLIISFLAGIYLCGRTAADMGVHDHGSIVWDEFVGIWITLWVIPVHSWQWILLAFVLFRFFDMVKPWPIRWFDQRVGGGFGIMIDDVIAAIIAVVVLVGIHHLSFASLLA